jgi:hypothetical protein
MRRGEMSRVLVRAAASVAVLTWSAAESVSAGDCPPIHSEI